MAKFLMCDPTHYAIDYEINPWMSVKNQANRDLAKQQWHNLVAILKNISEVEIMSGEPNLPDIVFTANAGVKVGKHIVIANFRHKERKPEKEFYQKWFEDHDFSIVDLPDLYFEGAGDCLVDDNNFYFGYGFRSDKEVSNHPFWGEVKLGDQFILRIKSLRLVDPHFYHLDTCFCPLSNSYALIYPSAFETIDLPELRLLVVPKDEAAHFACNAVCVGDNVVIPSGCPRTADMLKQVGFKVYDTDMSEFIKAGGACKCLTLRID